MGGEAADELGPAVCLSKRIRLACGLCGPTGWVSIGCWLARVPASELRHPHPGDWEAL